MMDGLGRTRTWAYGDSCHVREGEKKGEGWRGRERTGVFFSLMMYLAEGLDLALDSGEAFFF